MRQHIMANEEPMVTKTKNMMIFLETRSCDAKEEDELTDMLFVKFHEKLH